MRKHLVLNLATVLFIVLLLAGCASSKYLSVHEIGLGETIVTFAQTDEKTLVISYPETVSNDVVIEAGTMLYDAFPQFFEDSVLEVGPGPSSVLIFGEPKTPGEIENLIDSVDTFIFGRNFYEYSIKDSVTKAPEPVVELVAVIPEPVAEPAPTPAPAEAAPVASAPAAPAPAPAPEPAPAASAPVAAEPAPAASEPVTTTETYTSPDGNLTRTETLTTTENGYSKTIVTTVTVEKDVERTGVPLFVWILLALLLLLIILVVVSSNRRKENGKESEEEGEEETAAEPEAPAPAPVAAESAPAPAPVARAEEPVEEETEEAKAKRAKKLAPRFYGIKSLRDLVVITKNTARRADELQKEAEALKEEIKQLNSEIRAIQGESIADTDRRARLRIVKNNKNSRLKYVVLNGEIIEASNDDYSYLLAKITGEPADFRKTARFADKHVDISPYDVKWVKKHIGLS